MAEIYTLGAGTPTPTRTRFGSSHVLKLGDQLLKFNCGPLPRLRFFSRASGLLAWKVFQGVFPYQYRPEWSRYRL